MPCIRPCLRTINTDGRFTPLKFGNSLFWGQDTVETSCWFSRACTCSIADLAYPGCGCASPPSICRPYFKPLLVSRWMEATFDISHGNCAHFHVSIPLNRCHLLIHIRCQRPSLLRIEAGAWWQIALSSENYIFLFLIKFVIFIKFRIIIDFTMKIWQDFRRKDPTTTSLS